MQNCVRLLTIFGTVFITTAVVSVGQSAVLTVAPGGMDSNPGTPQRPLATLEAARDVARKSPGGPHRIVLLPGEYIVGQPLELDARDGGLTIEAAQAGTVTLGGGAIVTGWKRDGDKFWSAELPGVKDGAWDFRSLVVAGRMAERARMPESGSFQHKSEWKGARYLSGSWDPKPSAEQLTTVLYDPRDIPATLDARNAEIRVYHMWNESLYGVARIDLQRHAFRLSSPTIHPPGAFGVAKYVVFNTREGMTRPGQWYLDRSAGRLVYWPLPGEDMSRLRVIAPRLRKVFHVAGTARQPVTNVTLRGLRFQATTTLPGARGFGATGFDGAVDVEYSREFTAERLEVSNVGGEGIALHRRNERCRIVDCQVHHTGACGVEVEIAVHGGEIARNHIHHVGLCYPSAISLSAAGTGLLIRRNEIHDGPYSGIVANPGDDYRVEENLIYRVMQEMHDGAAVYGHFTRSVLRGNMVRDIVEQGKGYGAEAYYLDEQSRDSLVERNTAIGVEMPVLNHIARDITIRGNVFVSDGNMSLAFLRPAGCTFEQNVLFARGTIKFLTPNAITRWKDNLLFRDGMAAGGAAQPFTIGDAMPPVEKPRRRPPAVAFRVKQAPTLDGQIGLEEWPASGLSIDRDPSRWGASGVPIGANLCYDDQCLYVGVSTGYYQIHKLRKGTRWGQDDGAEIALGGRLPDGRPATFVIRGYPNGAVQSVTDGGAPRDAAERLGSQVRFATTTWHHGWRGEWAIPLAAMGLKPAPGLEVPFNLSVYRSEDNVWRSWEGTMSETWRLDRAGVLRFK